MPQQILVGVIVFCAAVFSVWKLMPARRRLTLLLALDARAARHPALARWRERSLRSRIARAAGPGCSGCSVAQIREMHGAPTPAEPPPPRG